MSEELSPIKRALLEQVRLKARIDELERARTAPIAVIGLGCRFPGGANSPSALWTLLSNGVDAITGMPADRWDVTRCYDADPEAPGKIATRFGGFLSGIDQFDAQAFGISPREAEMMDPQQRVLLEVVWEALAHAGAAPDRLNGSPTGVYIGIGTNDYAQLMRRDVPATDIDAYLATGNAHSIASGRISYLLGLQGPSVSLDTACSSSLVAVHLACEALRARHCDSAIAGGVGILLGEDNYISLSKARMMAPDGRCKTFDARADGFVRSEGCGVVVLKRLADAERDGDRVLAVIRGIACNQDGRSNGITAPNGPAQQAVIRAALANAGVSGRDVSYVETHGTGTALGDPIEVSSLAAVLGEGRAASDHLALGSIKSNLGHLEAAAGVAGLIKTVLALQHRAIPPNVHFKTPNPFISWDAHPYLDVPTSLRPWVTDGRPRRAGVSAFGFSGTNVHVVVEEAPELEAATPASVRRPYVMAISGMTDAALRIAARDLAAHVETTTDDIADVCFSVNTSRSSLAHRAVVSAADRAQLVARLRKLSESIADEGVRTGTVVAGANELLGDVDATAAAHGELKSAQGEWESVAERFVRGAAIDWREFDRDRAARRVEVPASPWMRERYWFSATAPVVADAKSPAFVAASAAANRQASFVPVDVELGRYAELWKEADRFTTRSIARTIAELGLFTSAGESHTVDSALMRSGMLPVYRHLLSLWLQRLARANVIERRGDRYVATSAPVATASSDVCGPELNRTPTLRDYLIRCDRHLAAIVTGRQSPLETLFPNGSFETADFFYRDWGLARYYNGIMGAVAQSSRSIAGRPLRVLEIGAGTGGSTASLVPLLANSTAEYWFTDVSEHFFARAEEAFAKYPFVRYRRFDLDTDPSSQGVPAGHFDLVIAANSVHATKNLRTAVGHARSLVAPGGVLMLYEVTTHFDWFEMSIALIEGWQHHADDLRGETPLLSADRWCEVLRSEGFDQVSSYPPAGSPAAVLGHHVVVASSTASAIPVTPAIVAASPVTAPPVTARAAHVNGHGANGSAANGNGRGSMGGVRDRLAALPSDEEREDLLHEIVQRQVMRVMRLRPGATPPNVHDRLMSIGMDSLMAVELKKLLMKELDGAVNLPSTLIFDYPTIAAIAGFALKGLGLERDARVSPPVSAAPARHSAERAIAALSEAEVEAMLAEQLKGLNG